MSRTRSFLNPRSGRPSAPLAQDVVIDGYRIDSLIGVGPLTGVYRGVLESHQQVVAVKVLLPHLAASEAFVQRFLQATSSARRVTHERVLPCYDVGQSNGWVYMACELVEGRTLADLAGSSSMDSVRALHIAGQVAAGMEAIHAAGLVHGNLRPSNVLLDDEDRVRLADLGLPVMQDTEAPGAPAGQALICLPPEAFRPGAAPSAGWDVYALGIILLGLLRGDAPWAGTTRQALADMHSAGRTLADEAGELDSDVRSVLRRATAAKPEERYRQASHLREDLERLQYGFAPIHARADQSVAAEQRPAETVPARVIAGAHPRRLIIAAVSALVIICAVAAAFVLAPSGPPARSTQPEPALPVTPPPIAATALPAQIQAPKRGPDLPSWASAGGNDAWGRWCDLSIGATVQRFRLIKGGSFWMGSPLEEDGRSADEERHLVTISRDYWLADSELRQSTLAALGIEDPSHFRDPSKPVDSLNWNRVQDVLASIGGSTGAPVRLPTEAEWEYACKAGATAAGSVDGATAWTAVSLITGTQPCASLPPNAWGLFDMHGNVAEWVEDAYGRYRREPATDPLATGGVYRVVRGGAWNMDPREARAGARGKALPTTAFFHLGLRLAISGQEPR